MKAGPTSACRRAGRLPLPWRSDQVVIASSRVAGIFVIVDTQFQLSETEKKKLRDFISKGGLIVLDDPNAAMPASQSLAAMTQTIYDITGNKRLQMIKNDHTIYTTPNRTGGPPLGADTAMSKVGQTLRTGYDDSYIDNKVDASRGATLQGVESGGRLTMLLTSKGYSPKWSEYSNNDPQMKFGVNLIAYAVAQKKAAAK